MIDSASLRRPHRLPEVLGPGSRRVRNMRRHEHSQFFSVALAVGIISVIAFTLLAAAVYLGAI